MMTFFRKTAPNAV